MSRDRNSGLKSKIIPKCQRNINGIEEKSTDLYASRMITKGISKRIKSLYYISAEMISNINNKITSIVTE